MKGIYKICFNDRCYVGKDSRIGKDKRLQMHVSELRRNVHWNKELQDDFNKYGEDAIVYERLEVYDDCEDSFLCEREKHFVTVCEAYTKGYNQTYGGIGIAGYRYTEEQIEAKSIRIAGELNPQSKVTNAQFFEMVELFKQGKTNQEVAEIYGLHDRYVSLIRHKKRFKRLWEEVTDYEPEISNGQRRGLNYEQFKEAVQYIQDGWTNKAVENHFGLSSGTGSRIRNKKLYIRFWNEYLSEQERSTTIPLDLK